MCRGTRNFSPRSRKRGMKRVGHFILIIVCIAGFHELRPTRKNWAQYFGGGFLVLAYMALIIATTAPR
jgi:hypothetical protein